MHDEKSVHRRRLICGWSLIALASILFLSRTEELLAPDRVPTPNEIAANGVFALVIMVLMIASVLGISELLRARADVTGLIGAGLTLIGWTAGSRIGVLIQLNAALERGVTGVPRNALQLMYEATPLLWASIVPVGVTFPLGLVTLGATLLYAAPVPRLFGVTLILGGITFPLGRAVRIPWAFAVCDFLLAFTFFALGREIVRRRELRDL